MDTCEIIFPSVSVHSYKQYFIVESHDSPGDQDWILHEGPRRNYFWPYLGIFVFSILYIVQFDISYHVTVLFKKNTVHAMEKGIINGNIVILTCYFTTMCVKKIHLQMIFYNFINQ